MNIDIDENYFQLNNEQSLTINLRLHIHWYIISFLLWYIYPLNPQTEMNSQLHNNPLKHLHFFFSNLINFITSRWILVHFFCSIMIKIPHKLCHFLDMDYLNKHFISIPCEMVNIHMPNSLMIISLKYK
jgi:hypothetical protein